MQRSLFFCLSLFGLLLLISCSPAAPAANQQQSKKNRSSPARTESAASDLDLMMQEALQVIDLSYTLNEKTPYWPGENYQPFKLTTIATIEKDGVLSKTIFMPEHLGTHIDAPNHFETNQPSVDQIPSGQLFGPGVVIDVSIQSETNADYQLQMSDVTEWEQVHGRIPDGAIVFLKTGWSRFWTNYERYKNQDTRGRLHFPGFSAQTAQFLVSERKVRGIGIDTLSIDPGNSKEFPVHHVVNGAGKYGLENVARLDQLPARDFFVIVAPLKIETGTGGPVRLFALTMKNDPS